jgi:hypothetical protein
VAFFTNIIHRFGVPNSIIKPRIYNDLNKFGKRWMKELPSVVWSLRTTPSRAIKLIEKT